MIASLLARISPLYLALAAIASLALGWHVIAERAASERAIASAVDERDAHWRAQIGEANRVADEAAAQQRAAADDADRLAQREIAALKSSLTELETKNAALPHGNRCGLDADRVRLLPP